MAVEVLPLTETDIPGAIEIIQKAFADDPYFKWAFDSSKVRYTLRNSYQKQKKKDIYPLLIIGLTYISLVTRSTWPAVTFPER